MKKAYLFLPILLLSLLFSGCGLLNPELFGVKNNGNNNQSNGNNQTTNNQGGNSQGNSAQGNVQGGNTQGQNDPFTQQQPAQVISFGDYSRETKFTNRRTNFQSSQQIGYIFFTKGDVQLNVSIVRLKIHDKSGIEVYSGDIGVDPTWRGMQGNIFRYAGEKVLTPGSYTTSAYTTDGKLLASGSFNITN